MIPPRDQISHGSDDNLRLILAECSERAAWYLLKASEYACAQHDTMSEQNILHATASFKQGLHALKMLKDSKAAKAERLQNGR